MCSNVHIKLATASDRAAIPVCVGLKTWFVHSTLNFRFKGEDIERATDYEYENSFSCKKIQFQQVLPVVDNLPGSSIEGTESVFGSSGLGAAAINQRKERSSDRIIRRSSDRIIRRSSDQSTVTSVTRKLSADHQLINDHYTVDMTVHSVNGQTIQDSIKLADKLRHQRVNETCECEVNETGECEVNEAGEREVIEKTGECEVNETGECEVKEAGECEVNETGECEVNETGFNSSTNQIQTVCLVLRLSPVIRTVTLLISDVEKKYQKDLDAHRKLTRILLQTSKNLTLTIQTIQESVARIRSHHIKRFESRRHTVRSRRQKRDSVYDDQAIERMLRIFRQKASVTADNCHKLTGNQLYLPEDVSYGVSSQFEPEGRTALRLAHFMSMYLQNVMPDENFGNLRGGGLLHEDQMFAEVIANVMGNFKIYSAGLFFDSYKFQNQDLSYRNLFGPEAFKYKDSFYAVDTAGYSKPYREQDWFTRTKSRFATNAIGTKAYKLRPYLRSDSNGSSNVRHENFPLTYRAATYETGFWTRPYFRCDGYVDAWVMKYVVPFFGQSRKKLEFRGVATVEVPLSLLEINQCPMPFHIPNAFKNTARCDYFSTK
ncbi:hypothetical protein Btru_030629, partial [Bulinus truncatus]